MTSRDPRVAQFPRPHVSETSHGFARLLLFCPFHSLKTVSSMCLFISGRVCERVSWRSPLFEWGHFPVQPFPENSVGGRAPVGSPWAAHLAWSSVPPRWDPSSLSQRFPSSVRGAWQRSPRRPCSSRRPLVSLHLGPLPLLSRPELHQTQKSRRRWPGHCLEQTRRWRGTWSKGWSHVLPPPDPQTRALPTPPSSPREADLVQAPCRLSLLSYQMSPSLTLSLFRRPVVGGLGARPLSQCHPCDTHPCVSGQGPDPGMQEVTWPTKGRDVTTQGELGGSWWLKPRPPVPPDTRLFYEQITENTLIFRVQTNSLFFKQRGVWGWPGSIVVTFTCSALVAQGLWLWIPGADLHTTHQAMLWQHPSDKIEEDWHRCELRDNLPQQKIIIINRGEFGPLSSVYSRALSNLFFPSLVGRGGHAGEHS